MRKINTFTNLFPRQNLIPLSTQQPIIKNISPQYANPNQPVVTQISNYASPPISSNFPKKEYIPSSLTIPNPNIKPINLANLNNIPPNVTQMQLINDYETLNNNITKNQNKNFQSPISQGSMVITNKINKINFNVLPNSNNINRLDSPRIIGNNPISQRSVVGNENNIPPFSGSIVTNNDIINNSNSNNNAYANIGNNIINIPSKQNNINHDIIRPTPISMKNNMIGINNYFPPNQNNNIIHQIPPSLTVANRYPTPTPFRPSPFPIANPSPGPKIIQQKIPIIAQNINNNINNKIIAYKPIKNQNQNIIQVNPPKTNITPMNIITAPKQNIININQIAQPQQNIIPMKIINPPNVNIIQFNTPKKNIIPLNSENLVSPPKSNIFPIKYNNHVSPSKVNIIPLSPPSNHNIIPITPNQANISNIIPITPPQVNTPNIIPATPPQVNTPNIIPITPHQANPPNIIEIIPSQTHINNFISYQDSNLIPGPNLNISEFEIEREIGKGSYGEIYKVKWKLNQKYYALKIETLRDTDGIKTRLNRGESMRRFVQSTGCPGVVNIYGSYFMRKGHEFIYYELMDLCDIDFEKEIKARSEYGSYYTEGELDNIIKQLISTLSFLQKHHVTHRDIKPQNILIAKGKYKLCDFGDIRIMQKEGIVVQRIRGSELYMSPILFNGLRSGLIQVQHNTYKSDVFSLGMCLFYAACLSFDGPVEIREVTDMNMKAHILNKYLGARYSHKLIKILQLMLLTEESLRPDFITLEHAIMKYGL